MTYTPEILPAVPAADPLARCALFVAFEGMGLLDLTGLLTVFWSATLFMEQQGLHGYLEGHGRPKTPHDLLSRNCIRVRLPSVGLLPWRFAQNASRSKSRWMARLS
jgi:hypothetical protein